MAQQLIGYRELTPREVDLINEIKAQGEQLRLALDAIEATPGVDKRFLAIGRTDIQKGFMAVVRAIARPTTFI